MLTTIVSAALLFYPLLLPPIAHLSSQAPSDELGRAIKANLSKIPLLKLNLDPSTAGFKSVDLSAALFRVAGDPYVAFKFKMPIDGGNRRFIWGLGLATLNSWYVRAESGATVDGFTEFSIAEDKTIRQYLTPGRLQSSTTYVMWMKLEQARAPIAMISLNAYRDDQLTQGWFRGSTPKEGPQFAPTEVCDMPAPVGAATFFSRLNKAKAVRGALGSDNWNRFDLSNSIVRHGGKAFALLEPTGTGSRFSLDADTLLFVQYAVHAPGLHQFGVLTYGELIELKSDLNRERTYANRVVKPSSTAQSVKSCGLLDKGPQGGLSRDFYLWLEMDDTVEPVAYIKSDLVAIPWKLALGSLPQ